MIWPPVVPSRWRRGPIGIAFWIPVSHFDGSQHLRGILAWIRIEHPQRKAQHGQGVPISGAGDVDVPHRAARLGAGNECTVFLPGIEQPLIVGGNAVCACLVLGVEAEGRSIGTVEGIAKGDKLHPLQQKFLEHAALQCGICTPGVLVAAKSLLDRNLNPTEEEVRYWLAGNLCRCTGYLPILQAGLSVDPSTVLPLAERYSSPELIEDLRRHGPVPVRIEGRRTFFAPRQLEDALDFKADHPEAVIVSGNTELGVLRNKKGLDPPTLRELAAAWRRMSSLGLSDSFGFAQWM